MSQSTTRICTTECPRPNAVIKNPLCAHPSPVTWWGFGDVMTVEKIGSFFHWRSSRHSLVSLVICHSTTRAPPPSSILMGRLLVKDGLSIAGKMSWAVRGVEVKVKRSVFLKADAIQDDMPTYHTPPISTNAFTELHTIWRNIQYSHLVFRCKKWSRQKLNSTFIFFSFFLWAFLFFLYLYLSGKFQTFFVTFHMGQAIPDERC